MLPTCLSRHMRGSGFDVFPQRSTPFDRGMRGTAGKLVSHPFNRWCSIVHTRRWGWKTPARKALPATSLVELQNSELRPFGRTSSTGPHTSGCRPFEINTFPAVVTLIADFGLVCAQRVLAIFDISFRSRVFHRFVPKNGPKLTCGHVFQHNFISKANLKNPEQDFLVHRFYLLRKQKECLWQDRFSS